MATGGCPCVGCVRAADGAGRGRGRPPRLDAGGAGTGRPRPAAARGRQHAGVVVEASVGEVEVAHPWAVGAERTHRLVDRLHLASTRPVLSFCTVGHFLPFRRDALYQPIGFETALHVFSPLLKTPV